MAASRKPRPGVLSRMIARRMTRVLPADDAVLLAAMRAGSDRSPMPKWIGRMGLEAVSDHAIESGGGGEVGDGEDGDGGVGDGGDGNGGEPITVRVYRPRGARGFVLYFHGGGFTVCSLDSHDAICCRIARASGAVVVSVGYRLAPEHPYPAAIEDAHAAYRWLLSCAPVMGAGDVSGHGSDGPAGIVVAGDSAGGNLAAVLSIMARDRGDPPPCLQVLYYPPTTGRRVVPSHAEFGTGHLLTVEMIAWFRRQYIGDRPLTGPYLAPANAEDLSNLPAALIVTAAFDPLRDEGADYAEKLRAAGNVVRYRCEDGVIHGFLNFLPVSSAARRVLEQTGRAMRSALDLAALGERSS